MTLRVRRMKNPRYGFVDVVGSVQQISVGIENEWISGLLIDSSTVQLTYEKYSIYFRVNHADNELLDVKLVTENTIEFERLSSPADVLQLMENIHVPSYWHNEKLKFFLFTIIRLALSVFSSGYIREYLVEKDENNLSKLALKQKRLTHIFLFLFEASQIKYSEYVDNGRARSLLSLGLNPKRQYEWNEIQKVGKILLKDTHPDTILGDEALFKIINAAVSYLK